MSTATKTCKSCQKTFPLTAEHFGTTKKYADGWNPRCRPCAQAERRKAKAARLEGMTDEEWRAHREHELARRKVWRERNAERLNAQRVEYRRKVAVAPALRELDRLQWMLKVDDAMKAAEEDHNKAYWHWKHWHTNEQLGLLRPEHGPEPEKPTRRLPEMTIEQRVEYDEVRRECTKKGGPSWPERRVAELREFIASFSEEELQAALEWAEQREREPKMCPVEASLSPRQRRWLQRYIRDWLRRERARTPEERAAREAELAAFFEELSREIDEGLFEEERRAEHKRHLKEYDRRRAGR